MGGVPDEFEAGVGEHGLVQAGGFERMLDEQREAIAFEYWLQVHAHLDAPGERCVGHALQGLGEARVTDEPEGEQIAAVEGEVQERGQIAEEMCIRDRACSESATNICHTTKFVR